VGSARYHSGKQLRVAERFGAEIASGRVMIHRGYSTDLLPSFADSIFDWVYIDSDHGYAVTARELALARAKVKPGGYIAGHDYVTANHEKGVRYGVVEAVSEFCVRHDWEIRFLTNETHQHRSFAIREIAAAP
jgi:predicted O-methyltransferase YrrM